MKTLSLIFLLMLAGCNSFSLSNTKAQKTQIEYNELVETEVEKAEKEAEKGYEKCHKAYESRNKTNYTEYAECRAKVRTEYVRAAKDPYPTLAYVFNAYEIEIAEKMDNGEISKAEGIRMMAEKFDEITVQMEQRRKMR